MSISRKNVKAFSDCSTCQCEYNLMNYALIVLRWINLYIYQFCHTIITNHSKRYKFNLKTAFFRNHWLIEFMNLFVLVTFPCINFTLIHDNIVPWSLEVLTLSFEYVCEIHKSLFIVEFKSVLCKFFFLNVWFLSGFYFFVLVV